jgi:hypothetical protein
MPLLFRGEHLQSVSLQNQMKDETDPLTRNDGFPVVELNVMAGKPSLYTSLLLSM